MASPNPPNPSCAAIHPTMASVPFLEAPWLSGVPSPYYSDSHFKWQKTCRDFIGKVFEDGLSWQKNGNPPADLFDVFAKAGFLVPCLPAPLPARLLEQSGITTLPGGLKVRDFDYFHYLIYTAEVSLLAWLAVRR